MNLSIPKPQPAVGGRPYYNDFKKLSSISYASSSPLFLSDNYYVNNCLYTKGSFNSVYALQISW